MVLMEQLVLNYLKTNAVGKANAVKSGEIEKRFGIYGEHLRGAINGLRTDGYPICSGRNGYWYAETVEELIATRNNLKQRIEGIERALGGIENAIFNGTAIKKTKLNGGN